MDSFSQTKLDDLESIGNKLHKLKENRKRIKLNYEDSQRTLETAKQELLTITEAKGIAQDAATATQQLCYEHIGRLVTKCLSAVFDDPYQFQLNFTQKNNRTQVEFVFMRDGMELDPMSSTGGGVVDVASFALRIAALLMQKPTGRLLLVLDEPFRFVSEEYRDRIKDLVEELSKELGIQFVIVTHMKELQCQKIVQIT